MSLKIHEGAVLISDAHYSKKHPELLQLLESIHSGKISTTQLILMGDMFELLFGVIQKTQQENAKEIELINAISSEIEVIYFEGNHDFGLKKLFPKVHVFPLQRQPQSFEFKTQTIQLSHGDTKTPLGYQIYTKFIRNQMILSVIGVIDLLCNHCIIGSLKARGVQKDPCYKIALFEKIIHKRLAYLQDADVDVVVEGHFHQGVSFKLYGFEYINLDAFACNRTYFIVQSNKGQFALEQAEFSAEKMS
jgi:UDP-2,3-diacylglucosamine hydrolase